MRVLLLAVALAPTHTLLTYAISYKRSLEATAAADHLDDQIISMGLPKTGTTATAHALNGVGYHVAHNQGDRLSSKCNGIANTMEEFFEALDHKHQRAKWIITYSRNASSWLDSVNNHVGRYQYPNCGPKTRTCTVLACQFYGCSIGLPNGSDDSSPIRLVKRDLYGASETMRIHPEDETILLQRYERYYKTLFRYFQGRPYALVDVRSHRYVNLNYIHPNLTAPFPAYNARGAPGNWPKC